MGTAEKRRGDAVRTKITAPAEGLPGLPPPSDSDTSSGSFSDSSVSESSISTSGSNLSDPRRRGLARRRVSPTAEKNTSSHLGSSKPQEYERARNRDRYEDNRRRFRSPDSRSPPRRSPSSKRYSPRPRRSHVSHKRRASYSRSPSPQTRKRALTDRRDSGRDDKCGFVFKKAEGEPPKTEVNEQDDPRGGVPKAQAKGEIKGSGKEASAEPVKGGSVSRVVNGKVALFAPPRKTAEKLQSAGDEVAVEELEEGRIIGETVGDEQKSGGAAEGGKAPLVANVLGVVREAGPGAGNAPGGGALEGDGMLGGSVSAAPAGSASAIPDSGVPEVPAGEKIAAAEGTGKKIEKAATVLSDVDDLDSNFDDVDSDLGDRSVEEEGEKRPPDSQLGGATIRGDRGEGQQKRSSRWHRKEPEEDPFEGVAGRDTSDGHKTGLGDAEYEKADRKEAVEEGGQRDGEEKFDERQRDEGFGRGLEREARGEKRDGERLSRGGDHETYDRRREDDRFGSGGGDRRSAERRREERSGPDRNGAERHGLDRDGSDRGRYDRREGGRFADDKALLDDHPRRRRDEDRFADERGRERRFDERRFDDRRFDDRRPMGREYPRMDERRYESRGYSDRRDSDRRGFQDRSRDSWQADRVRPPFREERKPGYGGSRAFDERGGGARGKEYPPKAVVFESDETMQADREERARRPAWGVQRGGGFQQPSEKWGHDKFAEVNQGGIRAVAEEDPDAKIEALLAL